VLKCEIEISQGVIEITLYCDMMPYNFYVIHTVYILIINMLTKLRT
jgi:hypothetical protein